jgi:hypothetical protein
MTIDIILLAALAVAGILGSVHAVARDGYARIPTRKY